MLDQNGTLRRDMGTVYRLTMLAQVAYRNMGRIYILCVYETEREISNCSHRPVTKCEGVRKESDERGGEASFIADGQRT